MFNNKKAFLYFLLIAFLWEMYGAAYPQSVEHSPYQQDTAAFAEKLSKARLYLGRSEPDKALPIFFELLQTPKLPTDTRHLCSILVSEAYRQKRDYEKGIDLIYSLLEKTTLSNRNRAHAYNRMAALYNEWDKRPSGSKDSTEKYSLLCIEIAQKNGMTNLLATSQNELGYIFRLRKEFDQAIQYCRSAYDNFNQLQQYPDAINAAINLCGAYLSTGQLNRGLALIDSAEALSDEKQYTSLYMRLYLRKSDLHYAKKEYRKAFYALKKARGLQEAYFKQRMDKQINEMSAKYDLQLKEQQIQQAENENRIQRQQKLLVLSLLIVLAIVFAITLYNFRLKRKIRAQKQALVEKENSELKTNLKLKEQELKFKNHELSQALTNMIAYNDTLKAIKQAIKANNNAQVLGIIASKQNDNPTWQKFKKTFNELHPQFLSKLSKQFPKLTPNDHRLCSFLLMDMKTNEIATVLNITEAAVSKSRNRLRKKLDLESRADIKTFLQRL